MRPPCGQAGPRCTYHKQYRVRVVTMSPVEGRGQGMRRWSGRKMGVAYKFIIQGRSDTSLDSLGGARHVNVRLPVMAFHQPITETRQSYTKSAPEWLFLTRSELFGRMVHTSDQGSPSAWLRHGRISHASSLSWMHSSSPITAASNSALASFSLCRLCVPRNQTPCWPSQAQSGSGR